MAASGNLDQKYSADHSGFNPKEYSQIGKTSDLAQQHEAVHAGYLMSEDHDELRPNAVCELRERLLGRRGKVQHIAALSDLAAGVLLKQVGNIGLVVDSEDADAHAALLA